jgi:hypothetical protein
MFQRRNAITKLPSTQHDCVVYAERRSGGTQIDPGSDRGLASTAMPHTRAISIRYGGRRGGTLPGHPRDSQQNIT